jgi:hypothetical protein
MGLSPSETFEPQVPAMMGFARAQPILGPLPETLSYEKKTAVSE